MLGIIIIKTNNCELFDLLFADSSNETYDVTEYVGDQLHRQDNRKLVEINVSNIEYI